MLEKTTWDGPGAARLWRGHCSATSSSPSSAASQVSSQLRLDLCKTPYVLPIVLCFVAHSNQQYSLSVLFCHDGKSFPHHKGDFTSHHHCHARIIKHRTPCTSPCFACESPLPPWHLHQAHPDATLVQTASAQYGSWRSGRRSSRRGSAG